MTLWPDDSTIRRLEVHEARCHSLRPGRAVSDLGDAIMLHDVNDADPFWNRVASVRFPDDDGGFDRRLDELVVQFAAVDRRAHVWASPRYQRPLDLERRLARSGFVDLGRGMIMALTDRAATEAVASARQDRATTLERLAGRSPQGEATVADVATVAADAFAVDATQRGVIVDDLLAALEFPGFCAYLVRVDGEPAAVAKATTFDGATYLSTIGTRPAYRARGLAAFASAVAAVDGIAAGSEWIYLGVFEANGVARRMYERLGFEPVGEPAGDWLLA